MADADADADADAAPDVAGCERRAPNPGVRHWLAVVDIDHFKRIDDLHGHLIGDEVLLLVAQLMRSTFCHGDRIDRFGGQEFALLHRCPAADVARVACERLRQRIEAHIFPQICALTMRIGCTCCTGFTGCTGCTGCIGFTGIHADNTPGAAVELAGQAVYEAKQTGRNRTVADTGLAPRTVTLDATPRGELEFSDRKRAADLCCVMGCAPYSRGDCQLPSRNGR